MVAPAAAVASLVTSNAQRGVNAAGMLLGTGVWWIRPGANVTPAFSQKYFALYSQNDWRPTPNLTINLGLRWEVQPGPTERFNRMSSWDFTRENAFGTMGAIAFPGVDGYSRNLWDTEYDNWGPRVGAAYSLDSRTVLRGGFGITYLPSNTGYFSGPTDYGSANFSGGVTQTVYGTNPHDVPVIRFGVPVIRFSDPAPIAPAIGADPTAPEVYGIGEARFSRDFQNGQARQWNVFIERSLFRNWTTSIGYTASVSRNLLNRSFPIQNLQIIPAEILAQWRQQYIDSNGTLNPATQRVPNPFQPASGPLLPFAGDLGAATIARQNTLFPFPHLIGSNAAVNRTGATADYHAMVLRVARRFADGLMMDASYTWSKNIDNTDTVEDNQGFNAGASARGANHSLTDPKLNRRLATATCRTGSSAPSSTTCRSDAGRSPARRLFFGRSSATGRLAVRVIWQTGFPIAVTGANTGAALSRPDRVDGVPIVLPESYWGWYDGRTAVTLPSGRVITPPARSYLKYNPDAFRGRVVTTPNGRIVADQFWDGNAAITYDEFRTDNRFNIDMSIRRTFGLANGVQLEVGADAMNVLNHTQFSGSYVGGLGGTVTTANPALGLEPGMGNANNFGTRGMNTFNPRQIQLRAALRF